MKQKKLISEEVRDYRISCINLDWNTEQNITQCIFISFLKGTWHMANSRFEFYVGLLSVVFVAIGTSDAAGNCGKIITLIQHTCKDQNVLVI